MKFIVVFMFLAYLAGCDGSAKKVDNCQEIELGATEHTATHMVKECNVAKDVVCYLAPGVGISCVKY